MTQPAIQVQNLGKQYQLGLREKSHESFREAVVDLVAAPFRRLRHLSGHSEEDETFWALRDISFDVPEGEVLGIIGRNGAGKSTLLKILSRITEPTEGRALVHGRVASLLEVGTGFHPELTGRENIFLNGAILGMSRAEITRKFDEIVDFSGVEKFLDTPIKRYSSGMKVRLAFAVAAHLEPEILIIDEVLAVGDAEFQKKCLGKMQDVAAGGRTVLFVSHNMAAMQNLCSRCIFLNGGVIDADGKTTATIRRYLNIQESNVGLQHFDRSTNNRSGSGEAQLVSASILTGDGNQCSTVPMGEDVIVRLTLQAVRPVDSIAIGIGVFTALGLRVAGLNSAHTSEWWLSPNCNDLRVVDCRIKTPNLAPGTYVLNLMLKSRDGRELYDLIENAIQLDIAEADVFGTGRIPLGSGIVFLSPEWTDVQTPQIQFS